MITYQPLETYRAVARDMGVQELMKMADTLNEYQTPTAHESVIKDILNNEVERRINAWEIAEV
jgi:hypothetical protein